MLVLPKMSLGVSLLGLAVGAEAWSEAVAIAVFVEIRARLGYIHWVLSPFCPMPRRNGSNSADSAAEQSDEPRIDWAELDPVMEALREKFHAFDKRYAQVRGSDRRRDELEAQQANLQLNSPSPELKKELEALEQELAQVELSLESELFSWAGLREIFWQAVRFGGLGIVLGWFLKTWAG